MLGKVDFCKTVHWRSALGHKLNPIQAIPTYPHSPRTLYTSTPHPHRLYPHPHPVSTTSVLIPTAKLKMF